jgi:DNA (cytosine-5)-methyltransferase 1
MKSDIKKQLKIFSFFAGVGFLDLGFEKAGFEVKYVNEFIPSFMDAYKHSRKVMRIEKPEFGYHVGDIQEFLQSSSSKKLKDLIKSASKDGLIGFIAGPPCPDFSVGGKNRGSTGERGKLSQTYINLIIQQKPDFFLFENVKGLWRTKRHREFYEKLKAELREAGYILTDRLSNSIEYGVPQDRDRIILLGFKQSLLDDMGKQYDSNEMNMIDGMFPWNKYLKYDKKVAFSVKWPTVSPFSEGSSSAIPEDIIRELAIEEWFRKNGVENHPNSNHAFAPRAGLIKFQTIDEGDVSKKSYKRLHRWRYSPTAAYGNNEVHIHPYYARRISAAEALAIQSLPKEFELPENMTLTDMFKTIGNGVPFLLSYGVASTIKDFLTI